jgi:hypothetical protein
MVIGLGYLIYLYIAHPQRVIDVGLIHLDDPEADATVSEVTS